MAGALPPGPFNRNPFPNAADRAAAKRLDSHPRPFRRNPIGREWDCPGSSPIGDLDDALALVRNCPPSRPKCPTGRLVSSEPVYGKTRYAANLTLLPPTGADFCGAAIGRGDRAAMLAGGGRGGT